MSQGSIYPLKLDDAYPCRGRTPGGEELHFEELLVVGQRVGHGDGEGNVFPPYGVVVRRDDGLWVEAVDMPSRAPADVAPTRAWAPEWALDPEYWGGA